VGSIYDGTQTTSQKPTSTDQQHYGYGNITLYAQWKPYIYRYNGTDWEPSTITKFNGSEWEGSDIKVKNNDEWKSV